jgi:hypothetical protein
LAYPHDRSIIEKFLAEHPNPRLRFHWSELPSVLASLAFGRDDVGLQSAFLYSIWQRRTYKKAIELHERIGFDIVHHVSYGSQSAPPPVWKLPVPFIWGPMGGAQQTPHTFRQYFGPSWARDFLRNARVRILSHSPFLRKAVRSSALVLATNRDTAKLLNRIGGRDVRLFLDSGLASNFILREPVFRQTDGSLTLLWAGRMQPRRPCRWRCKPLRKQMTSA